MCTLSWRTGLRVKCGPIRRIAVIAGPVGINRDGRRQRRYEVLAPSLCITEALLRRLSDLVNYAGVAGDANPIHWDEDIAKLAGLPT